MNRKISRTEGQRTFRITCWVLGLVAFTQLLTAGIALAVRVENAREVRIEEKIVTRIVTIGSPKEKPTVAAAPLVALPPPRPLSEPAPLPPARPLNAPKISDPVVERLVNEAREARVAEDMGAAIVKLQEARELAPKEPNVLYELGLVYETMAAYDTNLAAKAGEAYQKVFELGTTDAGALYMLAAKKLENGIARPVDMRGKLALGRTRIFKDDAYRLGERVVLTIPVSAAPGSEPSGDDFFVEVNFFEKTKNGEPKLASPESELSYEWISGAIDWLGGEEVLRVTYVLPEQDPGQEHLFGRRKYYGQVVELLYKNELIDSQAWPRHLASLSQSPSSQGMDPLFLDSELLPPDFDPNVPLLPPLQNELPLPPTGLPPLPQR